MSSLELARLLISRLNARKLMMQMINLGHGKGVSHPAEKHALKATLREMVAHA